MVQTTDSYRFFDQSVRIRWGVPSLAADWQARYARMALAVGAPPDDALTLSILPTADGLTIDLAGVVWHVPAAVVDAELIYDTVLHAILQRVSDHILIHAGVVARGGVGTALVAPSGHGKTTLTLALLRAGYALLSDETAAIERATGRLTPFARRLAVRPGTVALLGLGDLGAARQTADGRRLIDADEIRPNAVSGPVALRRLFIMGDPAAPPDTNGYHLLVNAVPDGWLDAARRLPDIEALATRRVTGSATLLAARVANPGRAFAALEALCAATGVVLLDVQPARLHRPTFDGPVTCTPLLPSEAARRLLGHLQHGHNSALFAAHGGDTLRLYLELTRRLADVACHALTPGPLPDLLRVLTEP